MNHKTDKIIEKALNHNSQKIFKEYITLFDDECKTNTRYLISSTPLLKSLFDNFVQKTYNPGYISQLINNEQEKTFDELSNSLDNTQKSLLEKYISNMDILYNDRQKQAYIYGVTIALNLQKEFSRIHRQTEYKKYLSKIKGAKNNG